MNGQRVQLPGSTPNMGSRARWSSAVNPNQKLSVTVTLRRQRNSAAGLEEQLLSGQFHALPREHAAQQLTADPRDVAAVRSFLEEHGLTVTDENASARVLKAEGTAQQMADAFSVRLARFEDAAGQTHVSYEGPLSIPQSLEGVITSVLGLDQRPIAKHHNPTR